MKDLLFSLDIGTRNVVGVLSRIEDGKYVVVDYEMIEHPERSMYDGQIHDISKVAKVARKVKEKLEERNDIELKYVSIAAAGRALKTMSVVVEMDSDSIHSVDKNDIDNLHLLGIESAQNKLIDVEKLETKYYCVGYTVINYLLDGKSILNLMGHKGSKIGAEVLATFLPHVVVDSLYTVVHRIGLEVINMTLEPIAAINIAIPENFRLLNLALVDIGAGTSDIAITKSGSITAYSMVAYAGDKLTEALSQKYLLDFDTAEKIKTRLSVESEHEFSDIVGIPHKYSTEDIMDNLQDVLEELTDKIAEAICGCNGKATSAIFCIGGSSKIPNLQETLAKKMDIPMERIVIKNTDQLTNVKFECEPMVGPEFVTPIGIGFTAYKDKEQDFLKVKVNDKVVRMFKSRELSVSDALLLVGFGARKLLGKKGKSIIVDVNGDKKVIYGQLGEPAKIQVNGKPGRLDTKVVNNDEISIIEALQGEDAKPLLKDIVNPNDYIIINEKKCLINTDIRVNERLEDLDCLIKEGDRITCNRLQNIENVADIYGCDYRNLEIKVNSMDLSDNYVPEHLDKIEIIDKNSEIKEDVVVENCINITVNGDIIHIPKRSDIMFVEIFNHIDFDIDKPKGVLNLTLNGDRANYTDLLKDGDEIKLKWN